MLSSINLEFHLKIFGENAMNTVERIKAICKERKIAISRVEKECGFANGYIGQLKKGVLPDDRLNTVASYLNISPSFLSTGRENEAEITKGNREESDRVSTALYAGRHMDRADTGMAGSHPV